MLSPVVVVSDSTKDWFYRFLVLVHAIHTEGSQVLPSHRSKSSTYPAYLPKKQSPNSIYISSHELHEKIDLTPTQFSVITDKRASSEIRMGLIVDWVEDLHPVMDPVM